MFLEFLSMRLTYSPAPNLQHQRSGAMDPDALRHAAAALHPLIAEVAQQVKGTNPLDQAWRLAGSNETRNIIVTSGLLLAFRKRIQEAFQTGREALKLIQRDIQNEPNQVDFDNLATVSTFCEALRPVPHSKETSDMVAMVSRFETANKSQYASNENRRGSGISKTSNVNVSGLWIKNFDLPAQYGEYKRLYANPFYGIQQYYRTYTLRNAIQRLDESQVDKTGKKTRESIQEHLEQATLDKLLYSTQRIRRSNAVSPTAYRDAERDNIRVRRLQAQGLIGEGTKFSDCDWRGAVLYGANLKNAYLELMDLARADLRLIDAIGATFKRTDFIDADVKGLDARNSQWGGVNGDYADFSFAYSLGLEPDFNFYRTPHFENAVFHHVVTDPLTSKLLPVRNTFDGADFRGAQFTKAQLVDFTARYADFDKPVWAGGDTVGTSILKPSEEWQAYNPKPTDFANTQLGRVNLEGSRFKGARFHNVHAQNHIMTVQKVLPQAFLNTNNPTLLPATQNAWLRPYRTKVAPVNLKEAKLQETTWDDTLLNRYAFDESKAYEEDDAKVNSNVLEPAFVFDGAILDGANFSKAKILIRGLKDPITVEKALEMVFEDRPTLEQKMIQEAQYNNGVVDFVVGRFRYQQALKQRNTIKQTLLDLFKHAQYNEEYPTFMENRVDNNEFIQNDLELKQKEKENV
jgi:uncharacterized protein YjbI with pentapeptide repeats